MPRKKKSANEDVDNSLTWTCLMDDVLVDAYLHQHTLGNRVNGNFTPKAYEIIVKELKEKIGKHIEKDKVKNRWKTIKANFFKCFELFKNGITGFSWSPVTKMWSAEPEVWQKLIETKPQATEWMTKPVANYDKLMILYGDGKATRKNAKKRQHSTTENDFLDTFEVIDHLFSGNEVTFGTFDSCAGDNLEVMKPTRNLEQKSKAKKARKSKDYDEVEHIKDALYNVAEALREGNTVYENSMQRLPIREEEVWKLLEEMEFENDLLDRAYLYFIENPEKVRAILGCPRERRRNIVMLMMFGSSHSPTT